jgi:MFS family permease
MFNTFRPLTRNRDFLVALTGRSVSVFGDEVALVALTLRLQAAGAHPYLVALLFAAGLVPFVLLAGLAGRIVDSADSRHILVAATLSQVCCCIPLVFTRNAAVMVVLVALLGCGAGFTQATWQALTPRLVGEDNVAAATAAQQTSASLASVLAPAVSGLLCAAVGTGVPLALDAVTFGVMAIAAATVRTRRHVGPQAGAPQAGRHRERGGWAVLRADPLLAPLVTGLAAFVLLGMMVNVVTVFLVRDTLHASAGWYGGLEALWTLGIVGGALASGRMTADAGRARAALAGAGLISLSLLGYGLAPAVVLIAPVAVLGGVGNGMANVCVATLVLTRTDERVRGRVSAALGAVLQGASVVSLVIGGALAAVLDPRQIFLLAGGLGAVVTAAAAAAVTGNAPRASARRASAGRGSAPVPDADPRRYFVRH